MGAGLTPWATAGAGVVLALLLAAGSARAEIVVPVEADLRALVAAGRFDPARDRLGLRGSHPPLRWDAPLLLVPQGDGRWAGSVRFAGPPAGGQAVAYKFRIERAGQGGDEGWESGPNRRLRLDGPAPRIRRAFDDPPDPATLSRTGTLERLGAVASSHVPPHVPAREVEVWLPPGYERDAQRRYPVLYLHDGQNVFDEAAAGAEWQVDETAQRLVGSGAIGPLIVVAVASGPQRGLDYTPTADPLHGGGGGGAAAYARYLVEDLKPLIDRRYRTLPGRAHTAVGGSSLGGLVSLWLALHHGQVFGQALVVSPSLWWDFGVAFRQLAAWPDGAPRPRLWLDMGSEEGATALPLARRMHAALRARGWDDTTLRYTEAAGARHDEAAWAARVEGMLKFLDPWPDVAVR